MKVCVFGIVERATNRLLLFPVNDRSQETLIPIIQKHVAPGAEIYSDGWASYLCLNRKGYKHFSVIHDGRFKQTYIDEETEQEKTVHTNTIEGAWTHAKRHFKEINGTTRKNFESHLCEVIFRNHFKPESLMNAFFDRMRIVFPLDDAPKYTYTTPIFSAYEMEEAESMVRMSGVEESTPQTSDMESIPDSHIVPVPLTDTSNTEILVRDTESDTTVPNSIEDLESPVIFSSSDDARSRNDKACPCNGACNCNGDRIDFVTQLPKLRQSRRPKKPTSKLIEFQNSKTKSKSKLAFPPGFIPKGKKKQAPSKKDDKQDWSSDMDDFKTS